MSASDSKAKSRALAREWEAAHGLLNLYKEDFAEESERKRADSERASTVLGELFKRLFNHQRHASGQPPLDEAKLGEYLAEGADQLPLHYSPAVRIAEQALACLPEASAFEDVAVMLVSTPDLTAMAIAEEGAQAICVSWTLLLALDQGNGVMARLRPGGISPAELAQELKALRPILTLDRARMRRFHPDQFHVLSVALQVLQTLFLVFHEAGHVVLRHLSAPPSVSDEVAADDFAFRALRHIAIQHPEIVKDLVRPNEINGCLLRAMFNFFAIEAFLHSQGPASSSHPDAIARFDHFTKIFGLSEKDRTMARLNLEGLKLFAEISG